MEQVEITFFIAVKPSFITCGHHVLKHFGLCTCADVQEFKRDWMHGTGGIKMELALIGGIKMDIFYKWTRWKSLFLLL